MSSKFLNRELSWLEFNYRVLEEALDKSTPSAERLKFLAIFSNNLDEFIMVRVAGLVSQVRAGYKKQDLSGLTPEEQLAKIRERIKELLSKQQDCLEKDVLPILEKEGYRFFTSATVPKELLETLKKLFIDTYSVILTPMAIDQSHPFPVLFSRRLNILIQLEDPKDAKKRLHAIIPVPHKKRFVPLPNRTGNEFIYIEELIRLFADNLFKGYKILNTGVFRVTRDAELSIDEEGAEDLLFSIETQLKKRSRGSPIRLEVEDSMPPELLKFLYDNIGFYPGMCFSVTGPLCLSSFFEFDFDNCPAHMKDEIFSPVLPEEFKTEKSIFEIISRKDRLIHHPYEDFGPVVKFLETAAKDKDVLAIKQTLYRTSGSSPVIAALEEAASRGKQVTVLVELKARFDEEQNINWAKQLEKAGCYVVYGVLGLKTHCKITLVVRKEPGGIKRYVHLSTGNYNDKTARIYTDIGFFTARNSYGQDASGIFNLLTGYSEPPRWKQLVCAPQDLRNFVLEKIEAEKASAKKGGKGKITAKINSLTDKQVIEALYAASSAGVEIRLMVRGICCLRPGVKDLSENISVTSIVDRFLEHSRIYRFFNNGDENYYLSSADWMERNFDRRVEVLFPVEDADLKKELADIFDFSFNDEKKARLLNPDGVYIRKKGRGASAFRSQQAIYKYYS